MFYSKCVRCGKEISVADPSKKYICVACKAEENIINGNVNNEFVKNFHKEHYYDKKSKKYKKKFRLNAFPMIVANLILVFISYLILCLYQQNFLGLSDFFNPIFYQEIYNGYIKIFNALFNSQQLQSVFDILIFIPGLFILYLLIPITIYNLFDLFSTPYWLLKKDSIKRKELRGAFFKKLLLLPIKIPLAILKYCGEVLLIIFVGDVKKLASRPTISHSNSYNQQNNSTQNSEPLSVAMDKFADEYTSAATYAYTQGGPIIINDTHGLTSDEIHTVISNSEAYLDTVGIHRKK